MITLRRSAAIRGLIGSTVIRRSHSAIIMTLIPWFTER
jgi:hypothetical protein